MTCHFRCILSCLSGLGALLPACALATNESDQTGVVPPGRQVEYQTATATMLLLLSNMLHGRKHQM